MKRYRVYFMVNNDNSPIEVDAEGLFDLVNKLETKYLYKDQYESVYKIEHIVKVDEE